MPRLIHYFIKPTHINFIGARKAAFFFSECGYYCEEPFMEAAPWIVTDIQEVHSYGLR